MPLVESFTNLFEVPGRLYIIIIMSILIGTFNKLNSSFGPLSVKEIPLTPDLPSNNLPLCRAAMAGAPSGHLSHSSPSPLR